MVTWGFESLVPDHLNNIKVNETEFSHRVGIADKADLKSVALKREGASPSDGTICKQ